MDGSHPLAPDRREIRASHRLLEVAEWELQQILLNIHDGPVQAMYAALSQLDLLQRSLTQGRDDLPPEAEDRMDRIRRLLESGLTDVRSFLGAFRSPEFSARDLPTLLRELLLQHEAMTDMEVEFQAENVPLDPPLPVRITLYRVLQEALSNAYRHGGANGVRVELRLAPASAVEGVPTPLRLELEVKDNGSGFDPGGLPGAKHFGLEGMRDRVEILGGDFSLESAPGKGTTVRVEVPLE